MFGGCAGVVEQNTQALSAYVWHRSYFTNTFKYPIIKILLEGTSGGVWHHPCTTLF